MKSSSHKEPSRTPGGVPPGVLIELQKTFFGHLAEAESAKREQLQAKKKYDEKHREFEEARKALFELASFLHKHQSGSQAQHCDWKGVAQARLDAVDEQ